jgi:hypothetical protein
VRGDSGDPAGTAIVRERRPPRESRNLRSPDTSFFEDEEIPNATKGGTK